MESAADVNFADFRRVAGRASYSTAGNSRFARVADQDEARPCTSTFLSNAVAHATTPPPLAVSLTRAVSPSPRDAATEKRSASLASKEAAVAPSALRKATVTAPLSDTTSVDGVGNVDKVALFEALLAQSTVPPDASGSQAAFPEAGETLLSLRSEQQQQQQHLSTPLELLPPRPVHAPRISLFSRPRTDSVKADEVSFGAAPAAETTDVIPGVYSDLFRGSFVNPFNGRLVNDASPSAKALFRVGFYRSPVNPLHLEWSPTEYIAALQKVLADEQRRVENSKKRLLRAQRRKPHATCTAAKMANQAAKDKKLQKRNRKGRKETAPLKEKETLAPDGGDAGSTLLAPPQKTPQKSNTPENGNTNTNESVQSAEEAVAGARAKLLRPLRRLGPDHWMSKVAEMIERRDVFTFLNKEMERLYAGLCAAYVPPKLDTPVDASIANVELTRDQKQVMQLAVRGFNIFVGGSAGTGKTVLLKAIFGELTRLGLRVAVTATTGVAAVQLGGCTFHHAFNAPVDATPQRWDVNALRAVDVVIVDEVSLLSADMFDAFDMEARLARMLHVPFGGLQVIVCGDFLQLSREDTMPVYESAAFKHLVAVRLVTPMRHNAGDPLLKLLEELRRGEFNVDQFQALDRAIPPSTTHITYIFPRRREAQQLNEVKLGELESREMIFTPQRGPLQLCGNFTKSALIEVARDVNGMLKPLPRREQLLDMIHAEAQRIAGDKGSCDGGGLARQISDHELVVMPVRTEGCGTAASTTRFILRLRCRDSKEAAEASATGTTDACFSGSGASVSASAALPSQGSPDAASELLSPSTPMVKAIKANKLLSMTAWRPHRAASPFSDANWERIAATVAARLGGRLLAMLSSEPTSMVPLSVSMTLADMTSPNIAHSLSPLRLKLGCRVMINRNLSRTVSNGSVGVVEAFAPPDVSLLPRNTDRSRQNTFKRISHIKLFEQLPIVRLLSGEVVQVPPVSLLVGGTAQSYYYGHEVLTIPLQLGYAFTVHKVQGLTLQGTVVLDCEKFFDCPHLIYVACSRVRRLDQLVVRHVEPRMIIVRRSALEFSDHLQEACALNTHMLPPTCARGSWAQRATQRILAVSD